MSDYNADLQARIAELEAFVALYDRWLRLKAETSHNYLMLRDARKALEQSDEG